MSRLPDSHSASGAGLGEGGWHSWPLRKEPWRQVERGPAVSSGSREGDSHPSRRWPLMVCRRKERSPLPWQRSLSQCAFLRVLRRTGVGKNQRGQVSPSGPWSALTDGVRAGLVHVSIYNLDSARAPVPARPMRALKRARQER